MAKSFFFHVVEFLDSILLDMETETIETCDQQASINAEYLLAEAAWDLAKQRLQHYLNSPELRRLVREEHEARQRRNHAMARRAANKLKASHT